GCAGGALVRPPWGVGARRSHDLVPGGDHGRLTLASQPSVDGVEDLLVEPVTLAAVIRGSGAALIAASCDPGWHDPVHHVGADLDCNLGVGVLLHHQTHLAQRSGVARELPGTLPGAGA